MYMLGVDFNDLHYWNVKFIYLIDLWTSSCSIWAGYESYAPSFVSGSLSFVRSTICA